MLKFSNYILAATVLFAANTTATAQDEVEDRQRILEIGGEVEQLLDDLEARASEFPQILQQLQDGRENIAQADQTVQNLITQLTDITTAMQDGSEFDDAIDGYKESTIALIAEGEASTSQVIRELVPNLKETLNNLEDEDSQRAKTVIEARNVIAELEERREEISFLIRANQIQEGARLISENVTNFGDIVNRARTVTNNLIDIANP